MARWAHGLQTWAARSSGGQGLLLYMEHVSAGGDWASFAAAETPYDESAAANLRRRLAELAQEHVDVSHSLPLNLASSAWCRCHPSRMDALRVAISAPEGTPYAAGVFVFDVRFPPSFPAAPPSVTMLTTGRGTVRFNPNLYECGKVCLSLLGTWTGRQSCELWNPEESTVLQVRRPRRS